MAPHLSPRVKLFLKFVAVAVFLLALVWGGVMAAIITLAVMGVMFLILFKF